MNITALIIKERETLIDEESHHGCTSLYDTECSEGVESFTDLPIFKKRLLK